MRVLKNKLVVLILLVSVLQSCKLTSKDSLHGIWRECVNDSSVVDYIIKEDTINVKICDLAWEYNVPYHILGSEYLSRDSDNFIYCSGDNYKKDLLIFKLISFTDSTAFIAHNQDDVVKLVKLKPFKNKLPSKIKFINDTNILSINEHHNEHGLNAGDYELNLDGSYIFCLFEKIYHGKLSDTLLNELKINYSLIDTADKRRVKHFFEIHQNRHDYKVELFFDDRIEHYEMTNTQPYQFSRFSFTLEKIWYEILKKSGHRIL